MNNFNETNTRKYLQNLIKNIDFSDYKKKMKIKSILLFVGSGLLLFAILFVIFGDVFFMRDDFDGPSILMIIGFVIIGISVILILTSIFIYNGERKKVVNSFTSAPNFHENIYKTFFGENIKNDQIAFDKIIRQKFSSLQFINPKTNEQTLFNIKVIVRTTTDSKGNSQTHYDVTYILNREFDKFENFSKTQLTLDTALKINTSNFKTESIDFNKKFIVKAKDELEHKKIFTPSVIDNLNSHYNSIPKNISFVIESGELVIKYTFTSSINQTDKIITNFRFNGNSEKSIIDSIVKKLRKDFVEFDTYYSLSELFN